MGSKYRIAVAGCGSMANVWMDYVRQRPDAEIAALVDIRREAAEAMKAKHGLHCPVFTDLHEALEQTETNLVFDITIPASHFDIASVALRHGCHVFAEKPLAETMEQCSELISLAEQVNRSHAVMQNRRFDPRLRALKKLIAEGTIGRPGLVCADFFLAPHFGGFRDAMDSPLLLDMAIHTFDQARCILEADPVTVYCEEFNPPGSWYKGNAAAVCTFTMSDGSIFSYRGSWCAEGAPTSWQASWRITGEKGTAVWNGTDMPYAEVVSPEGQAEGQFMNCYTRMEGDVSSIHLPETFHHGCLDEMFRALDEGRLVETDSRDNRLSMAMVLGALESAKSGRKVDIREL
ncbi:Gfo/Idh/MocA family protein [Paenibacillus medicaginis]|uniref:Gfo/Idh/MocA family protein n=1 Tax=Paenibacillus medicaginis TaxID=1470560 RepID=A0ABV5C4Y9_9BACL